MPAKVCAKQVVYTPGPWSYQEKSDTYTHIVRGPNNLFLTQLSQDPSGVAEANARLMASAPELLESAKAARKLIEREMNSAIECHSICEDGKPVDGTMDELAAEAVAEMRGLLVIIDRAITKAEGTHASP